jgi:parallel beta-helix repeat protein
MKKTLWLISFCVLFMATAFAQTDATPFTAVTLDTDDSGYVDAIDVYITVGIYDAQTNWSELVNDFQVSGFSSQVTVDNVTTGEVANDNVFRLDISSTTDLPTSISSLVMRYTFDGSHPMLTRDNAYLYSFNWMSVEDGAAPGIEDYSISTDHTNTSLAVEGSKVQVTFEASEELRDYPTVTLKVGDTVLAGPVNASQNGDRYNWILSYDDCPALPAEAGVNGAITVVINVEDFNNNPTDRTETTDIIYKGDLPTTTYANTTYESQAAVDVVDDTQIWLWDAFDNIQDAIDGVAEGTAAEDSYVYVAAGDYRETIDIDKDYLVVQGSTGPSPFIAPAEANQATQDLKIVEILANDVSFKNFRIGNFDTDTQGDIGVVLGSATVSVDNCLVDNVTVGTATNTDVTYGLVVTPGSTYNTIQYSDFRVCEYYGLVLAGASYNTISGCDFETNGMDVSQEPTQYNAAIVVENASVIGGLETAGSTNNTIQGNTITKQYGDGIYVGANCTANTIGTADYPNIISGAIPVAGYTGDPDSAIELWGADNNTIAYNSITEYHEGVRIDNGADNNTISSNIISENSVAGIYFDDALSTGNAIYNNSITDNTAGIITTPADVTTLIDADNNWWGAETGPYNETYNPQGLGDSASNDVNFSPWWTSSDMSTTGVLGSSEIAIQHAIDNTTVGENTFTVTSNADGTLTMVIDVDYPDTWDVNLPHELWVDALLTSDVALNDEAYVDIDLGGGLSRTNVDVDGTDFWLSGLLGGISQPGIGQQAPLYTDTDFTATIKIYDLDSQARTLTLNSIAARTGNFAYDSTYNATAVCQDNNDYRGITNGDGYLLATNNVTIQDPMQVALGTTLAITGLSINELDELSFTATVDYTDFPSTPALSNDWLTDAWLDLGANELPVGATVDITYNDVAVVSDVDISGSTGMWLSSVLTAGGVPASGVRTPLVGHDNIVDAWGITLKGLDDAEYTLTMYSVTAATGNFIDPTLVDASETQYVLAQDNVTFRDPIQYAMSQTVVTVENLANTTSGEVVFDIDVDYPVWTTNPELPEELKVDVAILDGYLAPVDDEMYQPLPSDVVIEVYYNDTYVDEYTTDGSEFVYLSDIIDNTPDRPALKDDGDGVWTLKISDLDAEIHNLGFCTVAAGVDYFPAAPQNYVDDYYYPLGWTPTQYNWPNVTFQDPMQYVIENITDQDHGITNLAINAADVLTFDASITYPSYTEIPSLSADWLLDAYMDLGTGVLPAGATLSISYMDNNSGGTPVEVVTDLDVSNLTGGNWLSNILMSGGVPSANVRTPLLIHEGLTINWGITFKGLDANEYTLDLYTVTAATANFVDPTASDVSDTQYVLAQDQVVFRDPIEYAQANSSLEIQEVQNIDAGVQLNVDVDYADITENPYIPENLLDTDLLDELYADALIVCFDPNETEPTLKNFPMGTDVDVTLSHGDAATPTNWTAVPGGVWSDLTFPAGQSMVWLSDLLSPADNVDYRQKLAEKDGLLERWNFAVNDMAYDEYTFAVFNVTATNGGGFNEFYTDYQDLSILNESNGENPWYVLGFDAVVGVDVPYFSTLELQFGITTTAIVNGLITDEWNSTTLVENATLELNVPTEYFYVDFNNANTACNTDLIEMNPFYIDTNNYPAAHDLGYYLTDSGMEDTYTYLEYWASKGVDETAEVGSWQELMYDIITGVEPFFYIRATGSAGAQTYELIDAFQYLNSPEANRVYNPVRINGDYFLGTYKFTGYITSASHDVESNGVNEIKSDLITVNLTLQDEQSTTYPEFTTFNLEDQVQGSNYWIDLESVVSDELPPADFNFTMQLNSGVDVYDVDLKDDFVTIYDLAPQMQPFYLADYPGSPSTTGWSSNVQGVLAGTEPMFYVMVNDDQTIQLVDHLAYTNNGGTPFIEILGQYPTGEYRFRGDLVGINGTALSDNEDTMTISVTMEEAEVVQYDLTIWQDTFGGTAITEYTPNNLGDADVNMVVNTAYDITIDAIDVNREIVAYYPEQLLFFESNNSAYVTLPAYYRINDGTVNIENGIISDNPVSQLYITVSGELFGESLSTENGYYIVDADAAPANPTSYSVPGSGVPELEDLPEDNGGWIQIKYTMSVDDPFYLAADNTRSEFSAANAHASAPTDTYGVSYYVVERDSSGADNNGDWQHFATIGCYDDGSGTNQRIAVMDAPVSGEQFFYRMVSVYNGTRSDRETKNHISYVAPATDDGSQGEWAYLGSVAAADNLPAYADMKVFLEGAYVNGGTMRNDLALSGAPANAVDEITVELRETESGATVKSASAYLSTDGYVINANGEHSLPFYYTTDKEYYMVINHRNHLAIMSSTTKSFGDYSDQATSIDLSAAGNIYGNDGAKEVETGVYAMYAGNANPDQLITIADVNLILSYRDATGYLVYDSNLDELVTIADVNISLGNRDKFSKVPQNTDGLKGPNSLLIHNSNKNGGLK